VRQSSDRFATSTIFTICRSAQEYCISAAMDQTDRISQLERLRSLREAGALTDGPMSRGQAMRQIQRLVAMRLPR
jgi:hypothetical protein